MASKFPSPDEFDDQFLTCAVCMLHYRDPKILPCLHSVCRECLQEWATKQQPLECPTCRIQVSLPDQGVDGLKTNFYVNNLLDFAAAKKGVEPGVPCQVCEGNVEGSKSWCANCAKLMYFAREEATVRAEAYFNKLSDLLQKRKREIFSQIDEQCRVDGKALQIKKEAIEFELTGLTSAQAFCHQAVEHGSDVHVLEVGSQVQTRVETLLTKQLDLESDWSEFQFVENTAVVDLEKEVDNFGGIKTNVDVSKCEVAVKPSVKGFECFAELTTRNQQDRPCATNSKAVKTNMKDPSGKTVPTQVQMKSEGLWEIAYTPEVTGKHALEVKVNSQHVSEGPFIVDVKGNPVLTIGQKGVAVDKEGNIAVVERYNKRVQVFDGHKGHSLSTFAIDGENPFGINVDSGGRILVTSWGKDHGLRRYSKEGKLLDTFKPDCLLYPHGFAVLQDGRMVVLDNKQKSCLLLKHDGSIIREIGKGHLKRPAFVSLDESRGVLFVTDSSANTLFAFDLEGNLTLDFSRQAGNGGKLKNPFGVMVDPAGNIIVANSGDGRVQIFGADGRFKRTVATVMGGSATGISLTTDGYIAVACWSAHCIELYKYM
ncbi:hypothetical protein Bbelb_378440 [Branchiostoma belcheri]|nr:hypothetical protein Bbelb_378440 [Branchiostoma belcheri]